MNTKRLKLTLEFPNNALVSELSGPHGKHLARLEQKLGVKVDLRGNLMSIEGDGRDAASAVLRALYARLEAGEHISAAEIDSEIRFANETDDKVSAHTGSPMLRTWSGKNLRARSPAQAAYLDLMRTHPLVFGIGPAGTGKTYLAAAFGAHLLYERRVERLILSRPALEAGERLGFLPGDLKEKIDPYLRPLYDALMDVIGEPALKMMEQGIIEVAPLAFMRGRTLSRAFVILDEAQNTTAPQMKMFLTRLGEDSRMVVTGDASQSDLPGGRAEGLNQALSILKGVEGVAVAQFADKDVVRHALVTRIVTAYNAADRAANAKKHKSEHKPEEDED
ncbi:phosphate starvation-inducible PhoH-like protein [Rhizomicrobium palustre]|uniref:PhoH-like protein n=1 Tax=Rhizomicrobium palustre TaxID=189966 RepID=A0A846MX47_9PROT|nr:PhoH family protein [Rhizomicrobium palustre]NIK88124.1 phosphate starvation-inducible PhoH-like protein [Rhizomicrobium palustre]